ncbi:hypothetical protein KUV57_11965 [Epibacterium sp. DP7N7-1]|nr:hypothetical protein [Epibacterium sp. DP7N7-1]
MSKNSPDTPISITAAQVSRVMDRILNRLMSKTADGRRVEKMALLNDFAAVASTGRNWGALLSDLSEPAHIPHVGTSHVTQLRLALDDARKPAINARPIGARLTPFKEADSLLRKPVLLTEDCAEACLETPDEGRIIGICIRAIETHSRAQLEVDPLVILEVDGMIQVESLGAMKPTDPQLAMVYRVFSAASKPLWSSYLGLEGLGDAYLVFGPLRCIGVIPLDLLRDRLTAPGPVDRLDGDAVRIIADVEGDDIAASEVIRMTHVIGAALQEMSYSWSAGTEEEFRLDLDVSRPLQLLPGVVINDLPDEDSGHYPWARALGMSNWNNEGSDAVGMNAHQAAHTLSQALTMGLRAEGIPCEDDIFVLVKMEESEPGKGFHRRIARDWRLVQLADDGFRELDIETKARGRFRRNVEAWFCESSYTTMVDPENLRKKSAFEVIAPGAGYVHGSDWEKALRLFELAS